MKKLIALLLVAGLLAFAVGCPGGTTKSTGSTGSTKTEGTKP